MKVKLEIKEHADRMKLYEMLQSCGYDVTIERDTAYMPPKSFVIFKVKDSEIIV